MKFRRKPLVVDAEPFDENDAMQRGRFGLIVEEEQK